MNKKTIIENLKREFPSIYVDIISHDAFGQEFQVRCFGVERSSFRAVRRKIISLNREMFPEYDVSLISIIFTMESTREHFPAIAEKLEMANDCCGEWSFDWFFDDSIAETIKPHFIGDLLDDSREETIYALNSDLLVNVGRIGNWRKDIDLVSADESYSMAA